MTHIHVAISRKTGRVRIIDASPDWEETKHPRANNGKFSSTPGGGAAGKGEKSKTEKPATPETKTATDPRQKAQPGPQKLGSTSGSVTPPASSGAVTKPGSGKGEPGGKYPGSNGAATRMFEGYVKGVDLSTPEARNKLAGQIVDAAGARAAVAEVESRLAKSVPTDAPVAKGGHMQPDGRYTPERAEIHDRLLDGLFTEEAVSAAKPKKGEKPVLTVLGGRGGSGKSWLTDAARGGPVDRSSTIVVDADHFKERLPEYRGWNAATLHEESSHLVELSEATAAAVGINITIDATMKTRASLEARILKFEKAGYEVRGYYMGCAPQESAARAMGRFASGTERAKKAGKDGHTGRYVPPAVVLSNLENERNFDAMTTHFAEWAIYDNNDGGGKPPRLVARSKRESA